MQSDALLNARGALHTQGRAEAPRDVPRTAPGSTPSVRELLSSITSVVLAGGGNRCWWQAGMWDVLQPEGLTPTQVAGVSAGAATACMLLAGKTALTLDHYGRMTAHNPRNFYLGRLLRGQRAFPHAQMYREALLAIFDAQALEALRSQPRIYVQVSRLPRWLGPRSGVLAGIFAYQFDKKVRKLLHPRAGRLLGFVPEVLVAQDCPTPEDLADLLLASSCTPPFTPALRLHGRPVLDGGMVDNVPVDALPAGPRQGITLVLLTRRYARPLPQSPQRIYVQPSRRVPVRGWDYTNPHGIRAAYELGRHDARQLLARLHAHGMATFLENTHD
ncbi:MAG: patatin-like phospholipase family protein [Proteobacteria bacterium]|nr:patatin-like phospholipase family protein [Pseudomonadota bacterium]